MTELSTDMNTVTPTNVLALLLTKSHDTPGKTIRRSETPVFVGIDRECGMESLGVYMSTSTTIKVQGFGFGGSTIF